MDKKLRLDLGSLQNFLTLLRSRGFETIGPRLGDGAIVYDRIETTEDLPAGWIDEQRPGSYRITKGENRSLFGFTLPPQSWKRFLYPPMRRLVSVRRNGKSLEVSAEQNSNIKYALIGVRPCELSAILVQDKVFMSGEYKDNDYRSRRENAFIVAVNCSTASENCFCVSMKTGPQAREGFDIALTEIVKNGAHYFVCEPGTQAGASMLDQLNLPNASDDEIGEAKEVVRQTASKITKTLDTRGLPKLLSENLEHPHWDDVAKRCLTCGNCTMVCPTCFCSTVDDTTDLSGSSAERTRRWDSCFTMDFAKVSGGNFRISPKSRYRQWLTHKLSSWVEQFGMSGCVGCGRCITWCPVGIDITAEAKAIRGARVKQEKGG